MSSSPRGLEQEEARDCLTLTLAFDEKRPEKLRMHQRTGSGDSGLATLPGHPLWAWDGLQLPDPCGHNSLHLLPQTRAKVPESAGFDAEAPASSSSLWTGSAWAIWWLWQLDLELELEKQLREALSDAFSGSFAGAVL